MDGFTRQERAAIVLLFMVVCSLVVLYWVVLPLEHSVSVSGTVLYMKKTATGGHLILTLDVDGDLVRVFVPATAGAAGIAGRLHVGDEVRVKGKPHLYRGQEEIVVLREGDIVVVSP